MLGTEWRFRSYFLLSWWQKHFDNYLFWMLLWPRIPHGRTPPWPLPNLRWERWIYMGNSLGTNSFLWAAVRGFYKILFLYSRYDMRCKSSANLTINENKSLIELANNGCKFIIYFWSLSCFFKMFIGIFPFYFRYDSTAAPPQTRKSPFTKRELLCRFPPVNVKISKIIRVIPLNWPWNR